MDLLKAVESKMRTNISECNELIEELKITLPIPAQMVSGESDRQSQWYEVNVSKALSELSEIVKFTGGQAESAAGGCRPSKSAGHMADDLVAWRKKWSALSRKP